MEENATLYRVHEFATRAGVTVRALHHYDRLGLLRPTARTGSRYRLYSDRDLARLEQIVVLKFLGLPLREIRDLLRSESEVADALRRQQRVLAMRRRHLDDAIMAIAHAERSLEATGTPDWAQFRQIITEIEMQNDSEWTRRYYSEDAQAKIDERRPLWSPELQERVTREWNALFADVRAALGEDPAGARAQALAARWRSLVNEFTGGDAGIQRGLNALYADQDRWPAGAGEGYRLDPEVMAFITKAMQARPHEGGAGDPRGR